MGTKAGNLEQNHPVEGLESWAWQGRWWVNNACLSQGENHTTIGDSPLASWLHLPLAAWSVLSISSNTLVLNGQKVIER